MDPNTALEFEAVIDTGFDGFITMPLSSALPLGVVARITTDLIYADGRREPTSAAEGIAQLDDESRQGLIILQEDSQEVLIGMEFLRSFDITLVVASDSVLLINEREIAKRRAAMAGPQPQPAQEGA